MNRKSGRTNVSVCCSTIGGEVAFSPDGRCLLSAGHRPRVWEIRSGKLLVRLTKEREFLLLGPIAFRGGSVLVGSQDGGIRVWDLATRSGSAPSPRSSDWVDTIAVQERTGMVVYVGFGKSLHVWNPHTNVRYFIPEVHPTSNLAFTSPDGLLAAGSANAAVEFWDIRRREHRAVLRMARRD
jgi:WD40 repeat protein